MTSTPGFATSRACALTTTVTATTDLASIEGYATVGQLRDFLSVENGHQSAKQGPQVHSFLVSAQFSE